MHITERLGNFALLRERLAKAENQKALMELEAIRLNALNEFRDLTSLGKTFTLGRETFDDLRRHSMSVEEKEQVVFALGGEFIDVEMNMNFDCLDLQVLIQRADIASNCIMLNVLTTIENITDGNGEPELIPIRLNFNLIDDVNDVFQTLIEKISLFYPKLLIGKVESKKANITENPPIVPDAVTDSKIITPKQQAPAATKDVTGKSTLYMAFCLKKARVVLFLIVTIIISIIALSLITDPSIDGGTALIFLVFLGLFPVAAYPRVLMQQVRYLKETNSYNCINEVLNGHVNPDPTTGFAFAEEYLYYKPKGLIIKYDSIRNIHIRRTRKSQNGVHTGTDEELIIDCGLKHKVNIFMRILGKRDESDTALTSLEAQVMAEIISRNPKVTLGYKGDK